MNIYTYICMCTVCKRDLHDKRDLYDLKETYRIQKRPSEYKRDWFNPKMAQPPQASTGDSACRNRRYRCSFVLTRKGNLSMCGTFSIRLLYSIEWGWAAGSHTRVCIFQTGISADVPLHVRRGGGI